MSDRGQQRIELEREVLLAEDALLAARLALYEFDRCEGTE